MVLELYLVGIVHADLHGPKRMRKVLNHIKPEHISLEFDENRKKAAENFKKRKKEELIAEITRSHDNIDLSTLRTLLNITSFSYWVSQEYCNQNSASISLDDNPLLTSRALEEGAGITLQKLIASGLLSRSKKDFQKFIEDAYRNYELTENMLKACKIPERDEYAASLLRAKNGRVVYIGGGAHIFGNYYNLFDRLADLNPRRMKLCEADQL